MIQPYTHQEALAQFPVSYPLGKDTITIYPLTLRAILDINRKLRTEFLTKLEDTEIQGKEAVEYNAKLLKIADTLNFESGEGREYFLNSPTILVHFVRHLCRFDDNWSEERLNKLLFPLGEVTNEALVLIIEMKTLVTRALPPFPKLDIQPREPKYKATQEEIEAKVFKSFAEKFGWNYNDVLDLTEYQIFWYSYLFPEEREHIEEMDALSSKNHTPGSLPTPTGANVRQITDPAEIQAWIKANMNKTGE
jgi:hypothetical protein